MSEGRILVTGATSGIGAGIARAFAALGDRVTATGATDSEVASAHESMKALSAIDVPRLDVRNGDDVNALVADDVAGAPEMITHFNVHGAMIYLDEHGNTTGYEDVFSKIELCRKHYIEVGLGANYVEQFVR